MRKGNRLFFAIGAYILIISSLLYGCGGAGGPGSTGTGKTNLIINARLYPTYFGVAYKVDAEKCQITEFGGDFSNTNVDLNQPADHRGTIEIISNYMNPALALMYPTGNVFIESYTISYTPACDTCGAPPITQATYRTSFVIYPPLIVDGAILYNCNLIFPFPEVIFVDTARKNQYYNDILSGRFSYTGSYQNRYTATYEFRGKDSFGNETSFTVQSDFWIGLFS